MADRRGQKVTQSVTKWQLFDAQFLDPVPQCPKGHAQQLRGGRQGLAAFLGVTPDDLTEWVSARSGPPRAVFEKAVDVILAEHDRRALLEKEKGAVPRRRRSDH